MTPPRTVPLNHEIEATQVLLIDAEGRQQGIVSLESALRQADEQNMDLVQMRGKNNPVVCRLMDYGKHLFSQKKQMAAARSRQKKMQMKEVNFRPGTDAADYQVKLRNLTQFLQAGDKTKVTIRFRGREIQYKDLAMELMERITKDLEADGKMEQYPHLEGKRLQATLVPRKATAREAKMQEIQFRPGGTEEEAVHTAEYEEKLRQVRQLLQASGSVKVIIRFRRRKAGHKALATQLMAKVAEDLKAYGVCEVGPEIDRGQLVAIAVPRSAGANSESKPKKNGKVEVSDKPTAKKNGKAATVKAAATADKATEAGE